MRRRAWKIAVLLGLAVPAAIIPATMSSARTPVPTLRMVSVLGSSTIERFDNGPLFANVGVYLAAVNGAFEIDAHKTSTGMILVQVQRDSHHNVTVLRHLPQDPDTDFLGIGHFLHLTWVDRGGNVVAQQQVKFCPATYANARITDSGPLLPVYPTYCAGSPLGRATVWGIDRGWAVQALSGSPIPDPKIPDGTYTLEMAISDAWVRALHITGATSASTKVTLTTFTGGCGISPCPAARARLRDGQAPAIARNIAAPYAVPTIPPGPKPDLRPARAWSLRIQHYRSSNHDYLGFAATVWDGGRGPLLVEGFRSDSRPEMAATQYFLSDGKVVGKARVGTLHFDARKGHNHWHFEKFARYDLVNPRTGQLIHSQKQSFCLAPTDPIDLTLRHADWQPGSTGLYSACGFDDSQAIWMREVLPVGWGDTYFQSVAGQSFNVTDLPNGIYEIRVTANPGHHLFETNYKNNVSYRKFRLAGTTGHRTATVLN